MNYIKRWTDFSTSEVKPFIWMLLGPLLLILSLSLCSHFASLSLLSIITAIALFFSCSSGKRGFLIGLLLLALYFVFDSILLDRSSFLLKSSWMLSTFLGLTISFLSMEELKLYYAGEKKEKEKQEENFQLSLNRLEEELRMHKYMYEKEIRQLQEALTLSKEEGKRVLTLVEASQIESDKVYKQHDALSEQSSVMHQEITRLKLQFKKSEEQRLFLEKKEKELKQRSSYFLKALNYHRVELYQAQLLCDQYYEQLLFFRKKGRGAPLQLLKERKEEGIDLHTFEKSRRELKEVYEGKRVEYQKLKKASASKEQLQKVHKEAEQVKSQLIGIEREIFVAKKALQEKGTFVT